MPSQTNEQALESAIKKTKRFLLRRTKTTRRCTRTNRSVPFGQWLLYGLC